MSENPTVVFQAKREVVLEDRPIPVPAEGEVCVRTQHSLISAGTETTMLAGEFPLDSVWDSMSSYPLVPGYSGVGIVEAAGEGVDQRWLGKTAACRATHSRYTLQPEGYLYELPEEIDPEQAAFLTLAQIAMNGLRRADVRLGETVVVFGMGLVGHLEALLARLAGAGPVFCVDVSLQRLGFLPDDPLLIPVNPDHDDLAGLIQRNGRMADVVIDATGQPDLIPGEAALLRQQGRLVILSSPRGKTTFDFHDLCNWPSISIIGAHNHSHPPVDTPATPWTQARHTELFLRLLETEGLELSHMITHRIEPEDAPAVYQSLLARQRDHLGVLIRWG